MGPAKKSVYVGLLTSGEEIVYIGGKVNESDCRWFLAKLDELISSGRKKIVVDYGGAQRVASGWLASQICRRQIESHGKVKIKIRHTDWDDSAQVVAKRPVVFSSGIGRLVANVSNWLSSFGNATTATN